MSERTRGLGKGLSALLGEPDPEYTGNVVDAPAPDGGRGAQIIPIELIRPNLEQPRRHFDETDLEELAASIKAKGVLQPILVRPGRKGNYEIVAGERRWRASQRAGLHEIPALIRQLSDLETLEIAVVENVQRADLGALEEAGAYRALAEEFNRTQAEIAQMIGKSRAHVANAMRLLDLPAGVRALLESGQLTAGHARAIATADDPEALARQVVKGGLSVRQAEKLAKKGPKADAGAGAAGASTPGEKSADVAALESDLESTLGLSVSLVETGDGKGELRLTYTSLEQLDDLCRRLTGA